MEPHCNNGTRVTGFPSTMNPVCRLRAGSLWCAYRERRMEISTANSTRRSRLGFFLQGVNALAEHTQNIIIVI